MNQVTPNLSSLPIASANGKPKRVLLASSFVVPHLGGVEQYTEWLRQRLTSRGHSCRVVSVAHPESTADTTVPYRPLGPRSWPLVLPSFQVAAALAREVSWADVLLLQYHAHPLALWSSAAGFLRRRKAFTFIHMVQPPAFRSRAYRAMAQMYDFAGAAITLRLAPPIAVSSLAADYMQQRFGLKAAQVPFPLRSLPTRNLLTGPGPGEPFRIVSAGRLTDVKAPLDLIAACDLVKGGPLHLDFYGSGPLEGAIRELALTRPWVQLHGPVAWEHAIDAQRGAHAVASASLADTTQAALLEPLAMGTPAVATDVGDAPDYFPPPLDCFLCPQMRPDLLASALDLLRSNYSKWQDLFRNNAGILRQMYSETNAELAVVNATGLH